MTDQSGTQAGPVKAVGRRPSRRAALQAAGVLVGGGVAATAAARWGLGPKSRPDRAISMAMHIHSSFSEQSGSMAGHLDQAQRDGVDVLWWSDHDFRMAALSYRTVVHFTSLSAERASASEGGKAWQWVPTRSGPVGASSGGIVSRPASPLDPVAEGSLHVRAQADHGASASISYAADATEAGWNFHGSLLQQSLRFEVLADRVSVTSYLEFLLATSYHPATAGRPAGVYSISYRFGGPDPAGTRRSNGLLGVVSLPVRPAGWNSVVLQPEQDIAALWPDLDSRDFASFGFSFAAVADSGAAEGHFDYLRIERGMSGPQQLATQRQMQDDYRPHYPGVTQLQSMEVSYGDTHLNWYGGQPAIPDYSKMGDYSTFLAETVVPDIHRAGGLACYNHPFGAGSPPALPAAEQDAMLRTVAAAMLADRALGADLLEVGYHLRAGVDIAHHIALWDICSRNGLFLTGTGATDDHFCTGWTGVNNDWITSVWAPDTGERALVAALAAGRAWGASLSRFRGELDLSADAAHGQPRPARMGSVSVSTAGTRRVRITARGLPDGSAVSLVQGPVDFAGSGDLTPGRQQLSSLAAGEFGGGPVSRNVDTSRSCYLRLSVHDKTNRIVALSNPLWLLREAPTGGIPQARRA